MSSAALIAAAGGGRRLGLGPKAFVHVAGVTLLIRSVRSFLGRVGEIVVAVPDGLLKAAEELCGPEVKIIAGANTRQATVQRLTEAVEAEWVLVHDVARPFVGAEVIDRVLTGAQQAGAATTAIPVADTLLRREDMRPVDREPLLTVQTPQAFRLATLRAAHHWARLAGVRATDDAGLVRLHGAPVVTVLGSAWLLKVTSHDDLEVAEALGRAWDGA